MMYLINCFFLPISMTSSASMPEVVELNREVYDQWSISSAAVTDC